MQLSVDDLRARAEAHRETLLDVTVKTGGAYLAQALSCIDLLTCLLYRFVRLRPREPEWPGRDCFLVSPGHYALPLYVCLADLGFFDRRLLERFKENGSPVELATHRSTLPGVEATGGSLGQVLSIGVGMSLAARLRQRRHGVFVLMSDGEQAAGQNWEAAAAAAHYRLGNLVAVVDQNGFQVDGPTAEVLDMAPLGEKYRAFNWAVEEVDGHDFDQVVGALESVMSTAERPGIVIGRTVRGKGISFLEGNPDFHYTRLGDDLQARAARDLKGEADGL